MAGWNVQNAAVLALIVVAATVAVAAMGFWAGRRFRAGPHPPGPAPAVDMQLVGGLIGCHDLARDGALRGHVEQVLRGAGIVALRPPPGSRVDGDRCEVVGTAPAPSPQQVGAVADLVRAGWAGGAGLVRPAQVTVFVEPS